MADFSQSGELCVPLNANGVVDDLFVAGRGDTASTLETIKRYKEQHGYVLDPHTAVGVFVAEKHLSSDVPTICLATAHPAKFTQAIIDATGEAVHHPTLDALVNAQTRCDAIANDVGAVKQYLVAHI
jgi:threonine synthase